MPLWNRPITVATTQRGIYAPDGSYLVEVTNGLSLPIGLYNARGNIRVCPAETSPGVGLYAPNGSIRISGVDEPETIALVSRMSTPPTAGRQTLINTLINSLKLSGVWDKLDCLWLPAAETQQGGNLNWKGNYSTLLPVNAPVWTVDRGYTGDGVSAVVNTTHNVTSFTGQYSANDASHGVWIRTNVQADTYSMHAASAAGMSGVIPRRSGVGAEDTVTALINTNTTTGTSIGSTVTSVGLSHVNRSSSNLTTLYKNGVSLATHAVPAIDIPNTSFYLLCRNTSGTLDAFDTREIAMAFIGDSFTAPQALAFYNAINIYLQGVGAA